MTEPEPQVPRLAAPRRGVTRPLVPARRPREIVTSHHYRYIDGLRSLAAADPRALAPFLGALVAGVLLAVATLRVLGGPEWSSGHDPIGILAQLAIFPITLVASLLAWPWVDRWIGEDRRLPTRARFNAVGVSVSTPGRCASWRWTEASRMIRVAGFLAVREGRATPLAVPERSLGSINLEDLTRLRSAEPTSREAADLERDLAAVSGAILVPPADRRPPDELGDALRDAAVHMPVTTRLNRIVLLVVPSLLGLSVGLLLVFAMPRSAAVLIAAGLSLTTGLLLSALAAMWRKLVTWPRQARRLAEQRVEIALGEKGVIESRTSPWLEQPLRHERLRTATSYARLWKAVRTGSHYLFFRDRADVVSVWRGRLDRRTDEAVLRSLRRFAPRFKCVDGGRPSPR